MTTGSRDWAHTRDRIHERWPGLPEEDIEASQGDRTALLALLQGRLGYARPNAEQDLDEILAGEAISPRDIADEDVHTGTSGPVGSIPPTGAAASAPRPMNGTRGEIAQETREESRPYAAAQPSQAGASDPTSGPEAMRDTGGPPMGGDGPWDHGPWGSNDHGGQTRSGPPKIVVAILGVGAIVVVGWLIGRRKRKQHTKTEQVAEQARHLLEEIAEHMPSVEELRDKVRSLDELREKKAKKVAAAKR